MRLFYLLLLLLSPLLCAGAAFDTFTDDDAGQMLYCPAKREVLVFQRCKEDANGSGTWLCTQFRGRRNLVEVAPGRCVLLNYRESDLSAELVALELAYWKFHGGYRADAFEYIARKMNAPITNQLLFFYSDLVNQGDVIHKEIKAYAAVKRNSRQASDKPNPAQQMQLSLQESALKAAFSNTALVRHFKDLAGNDKNFLQSFMMYLQYRKKLYDSARNLAASIRTGVLEDVEKLGEDLREMYLQSRNYNQNRENAFKKLCPDKHGPWEFAPPADLQKMYAKSRSCYRALRRTYSLSPHSEFPDWGNAMLEVLQMVRNPVWGQKFDSAYSEYEKYNSN